jgi:lipoate-protein ligase B
METITQENLEASGFDSELVVENWGSVPYEDAVARQLALVDDVAAGGPDRLVFCTHPPVVTLGRATVREEDLTGWQGATVETSRGGRATYHGPSQIVIYPILDLRRAGRGRDIHAYLRNLEEATAIACHKLGLSNAEARETKSGELSLTGVWVGAKKIASIGIAVRKWVTYHGVAINVLDDPSAHLGINPCGFTTNIMTNVERELGRSVDLEEVRETLRRVFTAQFEVEP